jgi:hypothetical protein
MEIALLCPTCSEREFGHGKQADAGRKEDTE